ncbi:MAG TPA: hypothetical protein VD763_00535 [Candidatus Saccharimonadales bacterium]|nr:hypothetical protein [Candidatus Saccharimonadales bacterium]
MSRSVLAGMLVATITVAACAGPSVAPSAQRDGSPVVGSPPPTSATPSASAAVPGDVTTGERVLLDGVRREGLACEPAAGIGGAPGVPTAVIECVAADPAAAIVTFSLFEDDAQLLDAYVAEMGAWDVALDSGSCQDGARETAYAPAEGTSPYRHGCFLDGDGVANYLATLPGPHVLIGIRGRSTDTEALADYAWLGNEDAPGNPTLWADPR